MALPPTVGARALSSPWPSDSPSVGRTLTPLLPAPLIGRGRELRELEALIDAPGMRPLTLVGPPGVGKQRLAPEVAHRRRVVRPDAVRQLTLNRFADARRAHDAIARLLHRGTGATLLLLDHVEIVLPPAARPRDALERVPDGQVLVTSRSRLRVSSERVFSVMPLVSPRRGAAAGTTAYVLTTTAAARMFVTRTRDLTSCLRPHIRISSDCRRDL